MDSQNAFDIRLGLSKADRLQICESAMTHAMVITGVHLDNTGKPVRYRVENSWGETAGKEGFFVMTDAWFDELVLLSVLASGQFSRHLPTGLYTKLLYPRLSHRATSSQCTKQATRLFCLLGTQW